MNKYFINIDDFCEKIFEELERISEENRNHRAYFSGCNLNHVNEIVLEKLKPFIENQLVEDDFSCIECGFSSNDRNMFRQYHTDSEDSLICEDCCKLDAQQGIEYESGID